MRQSGKGFFRTIYDSITDIESYKLRLVNKTSKAVVYLLLLTVITGLGSLIYPVYSVYTVLNEIPAKYDEIIPEFTFGDGQLNMEGEMPVILPGLTPAIIIDTSGNTDESILLDYNSAILVLQDRVIWKDYDKKQVTNFSMLAGINADKAGIASTLPMIKWVLVPVVLVGLFLYILSMFLSVVALTFAGRILGRVQNKVISFREAFIFSLHAVTLPIIADIFIQLVPFVSGYSWLVFFAASLIYMWLAISKTDFIKFGVDI